MDSIVSRRNNCYAPKEKGCLYFPTFSCVLLPWAGGCLLSHLAHYKIEPHENKRMCLSHSDNSWSLGNFCYLKVAVEINQPAPKKKKKSGGWVVAPPSSQQGSGTGILRSHLRQPPGVPTTEPLRWACMTIHIPARAEVLKRCE